MNKSSKGFVWIVFHNVSKAQFSALLSHLPLSISQQNSRKFSEKMKIFNFRSDFFAFMRNKNRHLKLLFRQLLVLFEGQIICIFSCFAMNHISEKGEVSLKKVKIFDFQPIIQSFFLMNYIFKGFIWVDFHSVSKAQFSAFLSYLPLSIFQQICRKFGELSGIFSVLSIYLLWSQIKSYLSVLI